MSYSTEESKIKDQLPFTLAINGLITEAERLRTFGYNTLYFTAVGTIERKITAIPVLKKDFDDATVELKKWRDNVDAKYREFNETKHTQTELLAAKNRLRRMMLLYADNILLKIQWVLDKNDMLLRKFGSEEGSI